MSTYKGFRTPESSSKHASLSSDAGGASSSASTPTPLSLVPEKAVVGHQIRSIVPAQFWGACVASASSPDGALASAVCDPAPLPLLAGAGLSRPHLVLATQALKLPGRPSLVGLPSVCQGQGGLVVDRVLAHSGGDGWWAVVSGRAKVGRMVAQRGDVAAALTEPSNYSLCANSRVQLRRNTIVRTRVDWSPAPATGGLIRRRGAAPRAASAPSHAGAAPPPPLSLSSELRSRLGPRAEVRADLAIAQRVSVAHDAAAPASAGGLLGAFGGGGAGGGGGGGGGAGATTPLLLGLQAGTPASSRGPVVWRVGALQVTAPSTVPLAGVDAAAAGRSSGSSSGRAGLQSAVYVQGTAALQGERFLWRAPKTAPRRRRDSPAAGDAAAGGGAGGGSGAEEERPPLPPPSLGPHNPVRQAATYMLTRMGRDDSEDAGRRRGSGGGGATGAGGASSSAGSAGGKTGGGAAAGGGAGAASGGDGEAPFGIALPAASSVQEALMDATQSISRLRDDVTQATQWVSGGGLVEQLEKAHVDTGTGGAPAAGKKHGHHPHHRRKTGAAADAAEPVPWSAFVGEPHVKVAGVAGLTMRAPVIRMTHGSAAATAAAPPQPAADAAMDGVPATSEGGGELQPSPLSGALPVRLEWVQDLGLRRFLSRSRQHSEAAAEQEAAEAAATSAAPGGRGGGRGAVGSLRPFASAAASVQLGRFSRWVADFTRLTAQLDAGLWGPAVKGSAADPRPAGGPPCQRHPAFALGDTGAWHSLSLSLSQQLIGPLRLAADWRYELGSHRPLALPALRGPSPSGGAAGAAGAAEVEGAGAGPVAAGGGLARAAKWVPGAARGVAGHVSGMRPQLLESVYALDLALPGSRGAARLVAWWAPRRREGMLELRLF